MRRRGQKPILWKTELINTSRTSMRCYKASHVAQNPSERMFVTTWVIIGRRSLWDFVSTQPPNHPDDEPLWTR